MAATTDDTIDTLVIRASGDIWMTSPTFNLFVNGVLFGGPYAVTASRSANEWQDIVVTGKFGSPDSIGIAFTNDYSDGTHDRNLYVDKITLNGTVFEGEQATNPAGTNTGSYAALWSNGTLQFDTHKVIATNSLVVRVASGSASDAAQFTVTVDGQQIGGVYSTAVPFEAGQWQDITVAGDFSAAPSSVVVKFVNDWVGGVDRSLFVDSITLNGAVRQAENADNKAGYNQATYAEMWSNGTLTFDTQPVTNSLTVRVAGSSSTGSAQFTVTVDGKQIGGVYAAPNLSPGTWQDVTVSGDFGGTPKKVSVNFTNDYAGGVDRTLYVDSLTLNGAVFEGERAETRIGSVNADYATLYANGPLTFDTYGEILLKVSQNAPSGGAPKFSVSVDGKQVGDILTTSASHEAGQWETIKLVGNFGDHPQNLKVTLLNDWAGGLDQNIWVDTVSMNGQTYQAEHGVNHAGKNEDGSAALYANGSLDITLSGTIDLLVSGSPTTSGAPVQFTVTVDGKQIGGLQTVTASHLAGNWQTISLNGSFGSDPGSIAINYTGEKSGGGKLYVDTVKVNGTTYDAVTDGTNYAGSNDPDAAVLFRHDSLTFDTDHNNTALTAFEGQHALAFASNAYLDAGDVLEFASTQSWSAISAIKVQAVPQQPQLIFGSASAPSFAGYEFFVNEDGRLEVGILSNFSKGDYLYVTGTSLVADGTYHVVGVSYDGSSKAAGVKIYVDGRLETTIVEHDALVGSSASPGPFVIGNQVDGYQDRFYLRGALDSFALSDIARPADYFAQTTPAANTDAHTVLAYNFDEGQGTKVIDASANHFDATIVGGVLWV